MRVVHSFWTEHLSLGFWPDQASMLRAFALSALLAREHVGPIDLVTDPKGKELLVDQIGIPYDRVTLDLESLSGKYGKDLWPMGKIKAYQVQTEPFLHIDGDLFLLRPLPQAVLESRITFQSMEGALLDTKPGCYKIDRFQAQAPWTPESWKWCLASTGNRQYAVNMGFYACQDLSLNRQYCREAFEFADRPENREFIRSYPGGWEIGVAIEQFTAAAVCRMNGVVPNYLVREYQQSDWNSGFVHLFWKQKRMAIHNQEISSRLKAMDSALWERCGFASIG